MANTNRHPMMSYLQPNKQKPLMMNFNGGQSPMGGNRSSDVPMGPPSDLQNPPFDLQNPQPEFMPGPIHPPMLMPDRPNPHPNFDPFPVDTWGRPDREEGDPTNPQKQDSDGNWYEWDGYQWRPIMGPKPDKYPAPNLIRPMLQGLKDVRPIWTVPFMFGR